MDDKMEMKPLSVVSDNNNVSSDLIVEVLGNGMQESSHLLSTTEVAENNGETCEAVVEIDSTAETSKCRRELKSLKEELNEVVVWKLKLWMVILLIIIAISLVIAISIIVCAVEEDVDEKYDKSTFVVDRFFKGNFTLDSSRLTSNPQSQETLIEQLKQQVTAVYSSSPALERYFSNVTISNVQDSTAQFELQFVMPSENEELVRYTLSLKMVKNVLLQHFYDQESGHPYVIPTSLRMEAF